MVNLTYVLQHKQVLVLLVMLVLRKRIALVIQLFKEAGKAVASMPFIILQPAWVSITNKTESNSLLGITLPTRTYYVLLTL